MDRPAQTSARTPPLLEKRAVHKSSNSSSISSSSNNNYYSRGNGQSAEGGSLKSGSGYLRLVRASNRSLTGHKVWHDESNSQLMVLSPHGTYSSVHLCSPYDGPQGSFTLNAARLSVVTGTNVLDVKLSMDSADSTAGRTPQFLAIQRNDTVVVVVNLETGSEWPIACRSKRGSANSVLRSGIAWISSRILLLVTRQSLEFHRVAPTYKLVNTIKHSVEFFWHLPSQRILLVGTGRARDRDTGRMGLFVIPYELTSHAPTRLANFVLPGDPRQQDVILISLYNSTYCVHNDQIERKLRLFLIDRDTSICTREIKLYGTPFCGVSVIDSLLCVHNMESRISLVYDLKADAGHKGTMDDHPTLSPLPIVVEVDNLTKSSVGRQSGAAVAATAEIALLGTDVGVELEPREEGSGAQIKAIRWGETTPNPEVRPGTRVVSVGDSSVEGLPFEKVMVTLREASPLKSIRVAIDAAVTAPPPSPSASSPSRSTEVPSTGTEAYADSWVFLPPHWVLDSRSGTVWRLELDLSMASQCATTRDFRETAGFLLRRSCPPPSSFQRIASKLQESVSDTGMMGPDLIIANGCSAYPSAYPKLILLRLLRERIRETRSLEEMSLLFASLNKVYVLALRERSERKRMDAIRGSSSFSPLSPEGGRSRSSSKAFRPTSGSRANPSESSTQTSSRLSTRIKSMSLFQGRSPSQVKSKRFSIEKYGGIQITQFLSSLGSQSHHFGFEAQAAVDGITASAGIPCSLLPLRDLRTVQEKIAVVLQRDLYEHCFVPLAYVFDSEAAAAGVLEANKAKHFSSTVPYDEKDGRVWLASVIIEYVRSLLVRFIRIEPFIYELLAWLLAKAGKENSLHQLLQYHVMQDSREFSQLLVISGETHAALWQSGIDMLSRISFVGKKLPAVSDICDVVRPLLKKKKVYAAMRLLRKHRYAMTRCGDAEGPRIRPEEFFVSAVELLESTRGHSVRKGRMYEPMALFSCLHHFFVTMDDMIVTPMRVSASSKARLSYSPLALAVGKKFPSHLFDWNSGEQVGDLKAAFGFP